MVVRVSKAQLDQTFQVFRDCGRGKRECQVLWVSAWHDPDGIVAVAHPRHTGYAGGFRVEDRYINELWLELARTNRGVRVQVHTHPGEAFHSRTDDEWPMVHVPGFLSLVIPDFARGQASFDGAYLAQIDGCGVWREADPLRAFEVT
jgi:hypothetical protein